MIKRKKKYEVVAVFTWMCLSAHLSGANLVAQTSPDLPAGVQDVVKLVKAGLEEDLVLAHIKKTGASYSLSADQLIYLRDQGVSQTELKALLGSTAPPVQTQVVPAPAPVDATPVVPATPVDASSPTTVVPPLTPADGAVISPSGPGEFQEQLAPFGSWIEVPGYGLCWRPNVAVSDPLWQPYFDQGHWVYTADGWYWQSDYGWGNIVFHQGRWLRDAHGWLWLPGHDWAPAWVCWRQADGYCGWAPLPPEAVYRPGVGLWYRGKLAVDIDFGLDADLFTFVPYAHFWDVNLHGYLLPRDRVHVFFGRSVVLNGYRVDHGRFIVEGLGRERVAVLTHRDVRVEVVPARSRDREREVIEHRERREERRDHRNR